MKKVLAIICLIMLLMPCALAQSDEDARLLEIADEMAQRMTALCANEDYVDLYAPSSETEVKELVAQWGGDWATAENRHRSVLLFADRDAMDDILKRFAKAGWLPDQTFEFRDYFMQ